MTVRMATQKDEVQLMEICRALHSDNGVFPMDDDLVRAMLYRHFNKQGGIIGVIDGNNELAAATCISFSHMWYSHTIHLEQLFDFVRPKYRKSDLAKQLLNFAKECQNALNVPLLTGILTNQRMEAKVALYRKKFGTPAGAFFVVGAHWQNESVKPCDDLWVRHSHGRDNKKRIIEAIVPATMTTLPLPMMPITNGGG